MGFFGELGKFALDAVSLPVAIVKDVVTMGGVLSDEEDPYTLQKLRDLDDDFDNMKDSLN